MDSGFSCALHTDRTAAARCPECRSFFCSECVSEHAGRMLCAACIARLHARPTGKSPRWRRLSTTVAAVAGLMVAWGILIWAGSELAALPDAAHERNLWREDPLQAP